MCRSLIGTTFSLLMLLGLARSAPLPTHAATSAKTAAGNNEVAAKALAIVSGVHGSWQQMPGNIATKKMTRGALIGNGSLGVALGGTAEQQQFFLGRNDFWSGLRGRIMPVGRLQLSIPRLRDASTELLENIGPADLTGEFVQGPYRLQSTSWVVAGKNLLVVELRNSGTAPVSVDASMWDAFGQQDLTTLSGESGKVQWLRVSPEIVPAMIGGAENGTAAPSGIHIRTVDVYTDFIPPHSAQAGQKPLYHWNLQGALASDRTTADASGAFSGGNIILPQDRFTVQALVDTVQPDQTGVLFSALADHKWMEQTEYPTNPLGNIRRQDVPRAQGSTAGLKVFISHGHLAADLNGTVVTANELLPLQKSTRVAVAYNGRQLLLFVNGAEVGRTSNFPTTTQVMGPQWQWAAAHPGDPRLPFDGSAPEAVLAMRVLGAKVSFGNGEVRFEISPGTTAKVLVEATDNRDSPNYFAGSLSQMNSANDATVAAAWNRHEAWWRNFWSQSYVEVPDKTVQAWWYGSLYVLASCSEPNQVAPGLWGNWITSTNMDWQGDYTLDYNYEAPFWAAYPTNHVALADPYDAPLLDWMERGRGLAEKLREKGLVYYAHLAPSPVWSADNFRSLDQKSDALFAAVDCIQRWRYTDDPAYARKVWPFLIGVAEYWDHNLTLVDGRYVDFNDAPTEHLWGPTVDVNPATTIGFLRMLYPALIDMSRQLHQAQAMSAVWQGILSRLSDLPLAPADSVTAIRDAVSAPIPPNSMVILQSQHGTPWVNIKKGDRFSPNPPVQMNGASSGMESMQVVFPAWNIGLESSPALRQAAVNTVNYMRLWYDSNDTSNFYPGAADAGYDPDSILNHLHLLVTKIGYPSFAYNITEGGVENEATVPTTIAAMLLQSYQQNIHVFADWPPDANGSFGNLLAVGDFLVSSQMVHGRVSYVRIRSQRGGICSLSNPWGPDQPVQLKVPGKKPVVLHGAILKIPTHGGDELMFAPMNGNAKLGHE